MQDSAAQVAGPFEYIPELSDEMEAALEAELDIEFNPRMISLPDLPSRLPAEVEASIISFQGQLLQMFPNQITQIILFGSFVRDEAPPGAEVDLLVSVRWSDPRQPGKPYWGRLSDPRWQQVIRIATDAILPGGPYISVLVVGESLLEMDIPVINQAKREGRLLWTSRLA